MIDRGRSHQQSDASHLSRRYSIEADVTVPGGRAMIEILAWEHSNQVILRVEAPSLAKADLRGANLVQALLSGKELQHAALIQADLRGADLCGADLADADLRGANLRD